MTIARLFQCWSTSRNPAFLNPGGSWIMTVSNINGSCSIQLDAVHLFIHPLADTELGLTMLCTAVFGCWDSK